MPQTVCNGLRLIHIGIHEIGNLTGQRIAGVRCPVAVHGQFIQIPFYCIFSVLHIVNRFFNQIMEPVYGIAQRRRLIHFNIRLHLPYDAADIFSAVHSPAVGAIGHHAGLSACNSPDVITRMFITHLAVIRASGYQPVRIPCNTSGIHTAEQLGI